MDRDNRPLILIDATASLSGGAVYLRNLITHLRQNGEQFRLHLLRTSDFEIPVPEADRSAVTVEEIRLPSLATRYWLFGSLYKMLWRLIVLPWLIWSHRPAIFFSNSGSLPPLRPSSVRPVVAIHNSLPFQPELWDVEVSRLRRWRLQLLHRQARRLFREGVEIIAFSEDLRSRLIRQGAREEQCTVIHHGIEWGEAERSGVSSPDAPSDRRSNPYFLYVSQLHRYKNVLNLLTAFADLRQNYPSVELVIVGHLTDPGYAAEIAATIVRLDLAASVRIIPGIDRQRLVELYRLAYAVVYPSIAENCPFALLESMAMGLPIAAARIGAITETCGEAAIYFDPADPTEITSQMARLLDDQHLCDKLRLHSITRAAGFDWDQSAGRTIDLFSRIIARPGNQRKRV
ncbi:MAG: hypothetical protein RIR86_1074 [Acidobacteriota bacterium]|jgi:glycosyltransferase involved in cell wall biosynthesis